MFEMMVHPDNWEWDSEGKQYLPRFGKRSISGGIQGVAIDGHGRVDDSQQRAHYINKKWILIPNGDGRLAGVLTGGVYLSKHPTKPHGFAHSWAWEGFEPVVGDKVEWSHDMKLKRAVQTEIVDLGLIPPMSTALRRLFLRRKQKALQQLQTRASQHSSNMPSNFKTRLEKLSDLVEDLRADYEKHLALTATGKTRAPVPKPKMKVPSMEVLRRMANSLDVDISDLGHKKTLIMARLEEAAKNEEADNG